jgi:hypothetical protein
MMGELFIKLALKYAIQEGIDEIYLTHYVSENDRLITLIEEFGFFKSKSIIHRKHRKDPENIFIKRMHPPTNCRLIPDIRIKYYPSFYDGEQVSKFLIPIKIKYHERLFTDTNRQTSLEEFSGNFIIEGNTIKKAYLCNSKISKIKRDDVVLFYCSNPKSSITTIGVVDQVYPKMEETDKILSVIGKRSVYSKDEIEGFPKPLIIIVFRWHFHLDDSIKYKTLIDKKILNGPPISILELSNKKYLRFKRISNIPLDFTYWEGKLVNGFIRKKYTKC